MNVKNIVKDKLNTTLSFSRPDGWDRIAEHISVHRHLRSLGSDKPVSWEEAIDSWKVEIYAPLVAATQRSDVYAAFSDRPIGDVFLEVSDHWHFLRRRAPSATPIDAADSYADQTGGNMRRFLRRIGRAFRRRPVFERPPEVLPPEERLREAQHDSELRKEIWGR